LRHARSEHGIGPAVERRQQARQVLRRVLTVSMEKHDELVAALDTVKIAELLVTSVSAVIRSPVGANPGLRKALFEPAGDVKGGVGRAVVDHEDLGKQGPQGFGNPRDDRLEMRFGVVRHDKHGDPARFQKLERRTRRGQRDFALLREVGDRQNAGGWIGLFQGHSGKMIVPPARQNTEVQKLRSSAVQRGRSLLDS
jgi:hypothetical protein